MAATLADIRNTLTTLEGRVGRLEEHQEAQRELLDRVDRVADLLQGNNDVLERSIAELRELREKAGNDA